MSEKIDQVIDEQPMAETAPEVEKVIDEQPSDSEPIDIDIEGDSEEVIVPEIWDKADLMVICGKCGHEEKITEAIGGVTIFMATKSDSETKLVCSECDNRMTLGFRNGTMLTEEEREDAKRQYDEAMAAKQPAEAKDDGKDDIDEPQMDKDADDSYAAIEPDENPKVEDNESQEESK